MPTSPVKPRDGSNAERDRYLRDLESFETDPHRWGARRGTPLPEHHQQERERLLGPARTRIAQQEPEQQPEPPDPEPPSVDESTEPEEPISEDREEAADKPEAEQQEKEREEEAAADAHSESRPESESPQPKPATKSKAKKRAGVVLRKRQ